ncbi:hypothetical protein BOW51_00920 [Solemya velesiana gill symbiont]|uniref:Uncharacterized protein n=1 Tax=Solemya velesiana gill symbiont TaxID=1918948 RepID=A0A1T2KYD0_9GAMM|nr:hypothetical protein BOW51_00920 [Solemya velesiana gill symbiont]
MTSIHFSSVYRRKFCILYRYVGFLWMIIKYAADPGGNLERIRMTPSPLWQRVPMKDNKQATHSMTATDMR